MQTRRIAFSMWFVGGSLLGLMAFMVDLVPLILTAMTLIMAGVTVHRSLAAPA
jgi:hypothetical protein